MHLFLAVLGGRSRGCHIEQHDVRFVAGSCIDDTVAELRRQWFGLQRGLHLDSWQRIERVEGRRVELRRQPDHGSERLWFVNLGAYDPASPAEQHAFGLFVAASGAAASARAKRHLLAGLAQQHKDDLSAVAGVRGPGTVALPPAMAPDHGEWHQGGDGDAGTGDEAEGNEAGGVDDRLRVDRVGRWHVHLLPPEPGEDTSWQPLRPDWFGYRRIDQASGA